MNKLIYRIEPQGYNHNLTQLTVSFWPHFPAGHTFLVNHICGRVNFAGQPIFKLFSLHIRSMWETICEAWACWSGWKFGPKFYRIPLFCNTVSEYPPIQISNFSLSPHLKLQNTPPQIQISNFFLSPHLKLQNTPPKISNFSLSPHLKLQNTPPQNPNFQLFPKSTSEVAEYPPPQSKCPTFP